MPEAGLVKRKEFEHTKKWGNEMNPLERNEKDFVLGINRILEKKPKSVESIKDFLYFKSNDRT
jgi:hypothetical protein